MTFVRGPWLSSGVKQRGEESRARERQALAIVDAALGVSEAERGAWIADQCVGDTVLLARVEALLAWESDDPTDSKASGLAPVVTSVLGSSAVEGLERDMVLGRYRLVSEIARGGMGVVWRARRDDLSLDVAIKVIKRGMDTDEILQRFRLEQRVLAGLQHDGIARLIDGDVTESGRPYFVMEYVPGKTLRHAAAALGLRAILELFVLVCDAVRHAHGNLVIHRDLKPSNIVVTPDGRPKLLDFGIAKVLSPTEHDRTDLQPGTIDFTTAGGNSPRTPRYASPEQLHGDPVSVSTDVYSLGVILYELLTGRHPFADETTTADELERLICEEEPTKPSIALGATRSSISAASKSDLSGDLDTIVLAAMHRDPERRYESVEQLGEDLKRYLGGFPVIARQDSSLYRGRKYARRNWRWLVAASVIAAGLVTALVWISLLYRDVSTAERSRAREARAAQAAEYSARVSAALAEVGAGEGLRALHALGGEANAEGRWELDRLRAMADRALWRGGLPMSDHILDHFENPRLWEAAVAPEGDVVAYVHGSNAEGGALVLHDAQSGAELQRFRFEDGTPTAFAFLGGSARALVGTSYGRLFVINLKTGARIPVPTPQGVDENLHRRRIVSVSASSDGSRAAVRRSWGGTIEIVDTAAGSSTVRHLDVTVQRRVRACTIRPDGGAIALVLRSELGGLLVVDDLDTAEEILSTAFESLHVHELRWSSDGTRLLAALGVQGVRVFDGRSGELLRGIEHPASGEVVALTGPHLRHSLSRVGDGTLALSRRESGAVIARFMVGPGVWRGMLGPDGRSLFAFSNEGEFGVWDVSGSPDTLRFQVPDLNWTQARVGANGAVLAARSKDFGFLCMDAETLLPLRYRARRTGRKNFRIRALDVHPTQREVICGDFSGRVRTYDVDRDAFSGDLHELGTTLRDVAYSPDGSNILFSGSDGQAFFFRGGLDSTPEVIEYGERFKNGFKVAFTGDGERFAIHIGASDGRHRLVEWDVKTLVPVILDELRTPLGPYSIEHSASALRSPDGSALGAWATGGRGCARLVRAGADSVSFSVETDAQFQRYEDLAFGGGPRQAFLGGADGSIAVLDLDRMTTVASWPAYDRAVHDLEWVPERSELISCSYSGEITLHRTSSPVDRRGADRVRQLWFDDPDPASIRAALVGDKLLDEDTRERALAITERLREPSEDYWLSLAMLLRPIAAVHRSLPTDEIEGWRTVALRAELWNPSRSFSTLPWLHYSLGEFAECREAARRNEARQRALGRDCQLSLALQALASDRLGDTDDLEAIALRWRPVDAKADFRAFSMTARVDASRIQRADGSRYLPAAY